MKLSDADIQARLAELPGWRASADAISRRYLFPSFADAVAFVTRLGFAAEAADHHPDLLVSYKRVVVTWSTHSAAGLTPKDFDGARQSDMIAGKLGGGGVDAAS